MTTRTHGSRGMLAALVAMLALGMLSAPGALGQVQGAEGEYVPFVTDFPKTGQVGSAEEYVPFVTDFPKTGPAPVATGDVPAGGVEAPIAGGLDWNDVVVGIGIGLGLSALLGVAMLAFRGRRQPAAHH